MRRSNPEGKSCRLSRHGGAISDRSRVSRRSFLFQHGVQWLSCARRVCDGSHPENADKPRRRRRDEARDGTNPDVKCKRARKRAVRWRVIGGVAGNAAGLKGVGTAVSGLFGRCSFLKSRASSTKGAEGCRDGNLAVTKKEESAPRKGPADARRRCGSSTITASTPNPMQQMLSITTCDRRGRERGCKAHVPTETSNRTASWPDGGVAFARRGG